MESLIEFFLAKPWIFLSVLLVIMAVSGGLLYWTREMNSTETEDEEVSDVSEAPKKIS